MAYVEPPTFMVEDAHLRYLNFEGREQQFNDEGQRSFCVDLPEELAEQLLADGWNVRRMKVKEEGDEPTPYINVAVGFKIRAPRITLISDRARTILDEESVGILDNVNIREVDLEVRGHQYEPGKFKAYLKAMWITINQNKLERKYEIIEDPA